MRDREGPTETGTTVVQRQMERGAMWAAACPGTGPLFVGTAGSPPKLGELGVGQILLQSPWQEPVLYTLYFQGSLPPELGENTLLLLSATQASVICHSSPMTLILLLFL